MKIRKAEISDLEQILILHKETAKTANGIARKPHEINEENVKDFVEKSLKSGLIFVAEDTANPHRLIAEIHCFKHEAECFKHTLSNLTIAVHPNFQGQGIGRKIFAYLLTRVEVQHPEIARIELMVRQSNNRGLKLYQDLGFEIEGHCKRRILNNDGKLESDIMMGWYNPAFII
ncbi:MAG: GNAT family N-acetyltransferase [Rickettsiales bacterium]|nr:GNAT family N-acetyltransferase [Rickettsiales bacterium]